MTFVLRHPWLSLIYALVKWGRWIAFGFGFSYPAAWVLGAPSTVQIMFAVFAFGVSMFNFGLVCGETGLRHVERLH